MNLSPLSGMRLFYAVISKGAKILTPPNGFRPKIITSWVHRVQVTCSVTLPAEKSIQTTLIDFFVISYVHISYMVIQESCQFYISEPHKICTCTQHFQCRVQFTKKNVDRESVT